MKEKMESDKVFLLNILKRYPVTYLKQAATDAEDAITKNLEVCLLKRMPSIVEKVWVEREEDPRWGDWIHYIVTCRNTKHSVSLRITVCDGKLYSVNLQDFKVNFSQTFSFHTDDDGETLIADYNHTMSAHLLDYAREILGIDLSAQPYYRPRHYESLVGTLNTNLLRYIDRQCKACFEGRSEGTKSAIYTLLAIYKYHKEDSLVGRLPKDVLLVICKLL